MWKDRENWRLVFLGVFLFATVFVWNAVLHNERNVFTIIFFDIGQGDAIFIESPNGNQMLIDAGATGGILQKLGNVMPFYDRRIDVVVATHPDQDHIGGLPDVLSRYGVAYVLRSGAVNDTGMFRELNSAVAESGAREMLARRGMVIDFGDGAYAEILFPDRDVRGVDPNDASIVMRVVYGGTEVMLTGDAPSNIEHYLVSLSGKNLESDILKVGHHGSKTSSSESFIGFVDPQYAVVSAGRDNRYGHPHQEVVERFLAFDIPVLSTQTEGDITLISDGEVLQRYQ